MATHTSILGWRIPWTEEPGGLQSMRSKRVGDDWVTNIQSVIIKINHSNKTELIRARFKSLEAA